MSQIKVTQQFAGAALPTGVTVTNAIITVGTQAPVTLTGVESPTPWALTATVDAGKGNVGSVVNYSDGTSDTFSASYDTGTSGTPGAARGSGLQVDVVSA